MNTDTIIFHGHSLVTTERDGKVYVAMKPIVEAIGLDWESQRKRLQRDEVLSRRTVIMTVRLPGDPRTREVNFLELEYLNGWLFGIDASRVKPELRNAVLDYQENCYHVLYEHYHGRARRQLENFLFTKYWWWKDILPRALQGLTVPEIGRAAFQPLNRVRHALKWMPKYGLLDPAVRIAARYKPATAQRLMQLPLNLSWGV